eukprot:COSAG02_NODE_6534_length_3513_cov_1.982718_2_plen_251_part_00
MHPFAMCFVLFTLPAERPPAEAAYSSQRQDSDQMSTVPFPSATATYPNTPWPLPQHMSTGDQTVVLASQITLQCDESAGCDTTACDANSTINKAVSRYEPIFSPHRAPAADAEDIVLDEIKVCVGDASEALGPEMNETHTLSVPGVSGKPVHISAASQHGVLRALESLAHLISISHPGRIVTAPVEIIDRPRWGTRGANAFYIYTILLSRHAAFVEQIRVAGCHPGLMVNPAGRFMSTAFATRCRWSRGQ